MMKAFTRFKVQAYCEWNNRREPDPLPMEVHDANFAWDWTVSGVKKMLKERKNTP
jgi:hypothetical protein